MSVAWHVITGEYPPQCGGVADYTRQLAIELVAAGEEVHVWVPATKGRMPNDEGVHLHQLPNHFGLSALIALGSALDCCPGPRRLLVQYVPQAFGWWGLNLPFCLWLLSRRTESIWVMYHEVVFPWHWNEPLKYQMLALVTRIMASVSARAAQKAFVSTPAWEPLVRRYAQRNLPITWTPVPSNIPVSYEPERLVSIRRELSCSTDLILGHFGTYGGHSVSLMEPLIVGVAFQDDSAVFLLLGKGAAAFRAVLLRKYPELIARLYARDALSDSELSAHLASCDLMLQPYVDGVSTRRTTVMAALSHGVPTITTSGPSTEPIWSEAKAVDLVPVEEVGALPTRTMELLSDVERRRQLSLAGRDLYSRYFDVQHTIRALRLQADCTVSSEIQCA